jgi:hypothetical protein
MSLLATFTWSRIARAVEEALATAPPGRWAVVEAPQLAGLLRARGHDLVAMAARARGLGRLTGHALRAASTSLPLGDGTVSALIGLGAGDGEAWQALAGEWQRVLRPDGVLVLVDRAPREELSRRALCLGLRELEQRVAGRHVVTSGLSPAD